MLVASKNGFLAQRGVNVSIVPTLQTGTKIADFSVGKTTGELYAPSAAPIATSSTAGIVKPDGTTITVDASGVISSSGGGGATGYTVTFANNFDSTDIGGELDSAPVTLIFSNGTSQTIDVGYDYVQQLRGRTFSNVLAVCCGKWTDRGGGFTDRHVEGLDVIANGSTIRIYARQKAEESWESQWADLNSYTTLTLFCDITAVYSRANFQCLLKGTLIHLANGQVKPIEEITYDDELLVWDFDNGCLATSRPLWIKKAQTSAFYFRNEFSDGRTLMTVGEPSTGGHRLFNLSKSKFTYSRETVGDEVYSLDGRISHISCERVDEPCEFYNVITDRHMNLFADGILTSCRFNNLYPRKDMKFVKDERKLRPIEAYDVPLEYYNGLRLGEQTMDIAEVNKYVGNLINIAVERKIYDEE